MGTAGGRGNTEIRAWQGSQEELTFGEHLKCIPGTGSVVTYMVIHRYRYSVPTIQKNLLLIIDLAGRKKKQAKIRRSLEANKIHKGK